MIEFKTNTTPRLSVRLVDSSGRGVVNVVFSNVTASLEDQNGNAVEIPVSASSWVEVGGANGGFKNSGTYALFLTSSMTTVAGELVYAVSGSGWETFVGLVKLVDNEEVDTFNLTSTVRTTGSLTYVEAKGANLSASLARYYAQNSDVSSSLAYFTAFSAVASASLAGYYAQNSDVSSSLVHTIVSGTKNFLEGRWKIHLTGSDAGRQVFYDFAGNVIKKYDLLGSDYVTIDTTTTYERKPV